MIVSIKGDVMVRELDGEAVLLDLDSGVYFGFNAVATLIWSRMSAVGAVAFDQLVVQVVGEFAVDPREAERDVGIFVEALRANGLVHVRR
jgi:hypothetical protein